MNLHSIRQRLCITRWLFGERRKRKQFVTEEKRGGPIKRLNVACDRLDKAADDLSKTVSKRISRDDR